MMKSPVNEYLLQCTVIELRCLKPKNKNGLSNPFVVISCGNLKPQATPVIYDSLEANYNQSFTFEGLKLTEQDLQTNDLVFEVYSKNSFMRNELIGLYSIGLSTLYKNANHEFYNMWVVLFNQDEDPEEPQGYLLLDAFIIGPGDRPPVHDRNDKVNQDVEEEDEELNTDEMTFEQLREYQEKKQSYVIIGKPPVARKAFQLSVYLFKAEHLAIFDKKVPNSFISARVAGLGRHTKVVKKSDAPTFLQKLQFPVFFPFLNDKILLRIWTERPGSKDEFIANIPEIQNNNDFFNLSKLMAMGGRMPSKWINLYGIPYEDRNYVLPSSKRFKKSKEGTAFMGRVMLSCSLLPEEVPICATCPCNMFYEQDPQSYTLYCDIYQLKYLKQEEYDISVWCECSIGSESTGMNKQKAPDKDGNVVWKNKTKINEITLTGLNNIYFPKDYNQIPDIFVNLYTGDGNGLNQRRIGYIRLKAEEVNKWTALATPRWLHFKPLDIEKDSPASVLINLQFFPSSESNKRIFKQEGITQKFKLYAHIVNGFELCPKDKEEDSELETFVEVNLGEKKRTEIRKGRYPMWNQVLNLEAELDWKLDFSPDIMVICYAKAKKNPFDKEKSGEREIGRFCVPIDSVRKLKKYPHYYNLIKNNEISGRIMCLFFINSAKQNSLGKKFGYIQQVLEKESLADIDIYTLGIRNLEPFTFDNTPTSKPLEDINYNVYLTGYSGENEVSKTGNEDRNEKIKLINPKGSEKINYINICENHKFQVKIRGTEEFQIYPYMKMEYSYKKFFGIEKRFLILNLGDFANSVSDNKKKLYRILFEQNLGDISLAQRQRLFPEEIVKDDLIKLEEGNNDDEETGGLFNNEENLDILAGLEKPKKNENESKKSSLLPNDEDLNEEKKVLYYMKNYKNMVIDDNFYLECKPSDKAKEKEMMKVLRRNYKEQMKEIRKLDNPSLQQRNKLIDLENKFREAKKPLMNEAIFYGFEDLSDEYNYGRDVYKEDVYENHHNLVIPYKKEKLYYVEKGYGLSDNYTTLNGYYKYGKPSESIIKFNVKVKFQEEEKLFGTKQTEKKTKSKREKNTKFSEDDIFEDELNKLIESYNIFNHIFQEKFKILFFNKDAMKNVDKKSDMKLYLNKLKVRVYIYRCVNIAAQENLTSIVDMAAGYDAFSTATSYIDIRLGNGNQPGKFVNTADSPVENSLSPEFYRTFEMDAAIPEEWKLTISLYNKDSGKSKDSLIGQTTIDLEDRFLGEKRTRGLLMMKSLEDDLTDKLEKENDKNEDKNIKLTEKIEKQLDVLHRKLNELKETEVPVEFRPLTKEGVSTAQGIIEMFTQILPIDRAKIVKMAKIEPPPPQEFELRLVIWETRNIVYERKHKKINAMIGVLYNPEGFKCEPIKKETDVHNGCDDGKAEFNWRMKFNLNIPCTFPRLTFFLKDFNVFSADDAHSYCTISVKRLIKKLVKDGRLEIKNKWIQLGNRNDPGEVKAEVKIDLYFLPKSEADADPVGEAREAPNKNPYLEFPKSGRGISDFLKGTWLDVTSWKFNFSLFGTMKIIIIVAIIVVIFVILFVAPGIFVK